MYYFKACPRCHGDLFEDTDVYGPYIACMQCGHYITAANEAGLTQSDLNPGRHLAMPADSSKIAA